jgi:hypothetical protein
MNILKDFIRMIFGIDEKDQISNSTIFVVLGLLAVALFLLALSR